MVTRIVTRSALSTGKRQLATAISRQCLGAQCRPALQCRQYSTPSAEPTKPIDLRSQFQNATPPPPQGPVRPAPKRSLRIYIYATISLLFGLTAGQYVKMVIAPPPLPLPNSPEDKLMVEFLAKRASKLPIVQSLSEDPAWESWDAYEHFKSPEAEHRLTTGALSGARGVGGFQRIFYNSETGECISVVWFGGALAGWPGVTHGGFLATIMDESLGRCAINQFPQKTAVTANLELNYLKPSIINDFYVIRTFPEKQGATERKTWVAGRIETLDGRVCVEARALFVVPKKFTTKVISGRF
ncbi:UPF0644 protein PB2B4.06 [Phlyctema vagabunda]|uniref:UPF0644 protein PB2B4.06 n=1 Tax=Phlyctema vagabunda TaxID=108571 RepID=A0ABR4PGM9_9HELO